MSKRSVFVALMGYFLSILCTHAAEYPITAATGVQFFQLDFPADDPPVANSSVGLLEANLIMVRAYSGIPAGYINVVRDGEWVVRNMIVPPEYEYPYSHLTTEFNLQVTPGTDVSSFNALVIYSDSVALTTPTGAGVGTSVFPVGNQAIRQSGVSGASGNRGAGASGPPDLTDILFGTAGAHTQSIFQLDHPNLEAATNQCYPMAVANSLQFLEDTTDLVLPHSHVPGLRGDNSLVGQLDLAMNRTAASRTSGSGVDDIPGINGKLKYLVQNGLQDRVQTRHWGRFAGNTAGSFSSGNKSGSSTAGGTSIPFDEILSSLERGENCEAAYTFVSGTKADGSPKYGGHAIDIVAAGYTAGQPWIIESSDLNQDSDSLGGGPSGFRFHNLKDTDKDGDYNLNGTTRNLDLLICQKYLPPPDTSSTALPLMNMTYPLITGNTMITKTTDPGGHSCCAESPPSTVTLSFSNGRIIVNGDAPWLPINAPFSGNSFSGSSTSSVAGFSGVNNSMTGTINATGLKATVTLGTNGVLPGGQPISWDITITPTTPWPWLPEGKANTGTKPRLRVNGFRDIITVKAGEPLSFNLSMDPGDKAGSPADWFLIAKLDSTGEMFHYDLSIGNWMPGVTPTYQGDLMTLPNTPLHTRMPGLPKGRYTFTFGVDSNCNGQIDQSLLISDVVTLVVQ